MTTTETNMNSIVPSISLPNPVPADCAESLSEDLRRHLFYTLAHHHEAVDPEYQYHALALATRDRLIAHWRDTQKRMAESDQRKVYYLSLEFLIGRSLTNAVQNLDMGEAARAALSEQGVRLEELAEQEHDAGLGNGGLGRLAACFLDSCANLQLPVVGYGIRYEYGMFHQRIEDGRQIESPDHWLRDGNPWEIKRPESTRTVKFYGHTERHMDESGRMHARWVNTQDVVAIPHDMPIPGYQNGTVNTLRLWKSTATNVF